MGPTQSSNLVRDVTNTIIESANRAAVDSFTSQSCANIVSLNNCDLSNVNINQDMDCIITQQIMNTASQSASAAITDEKTIKQLADTIAQNLDLNPGSKESSNITELITNLSVAVNNTVTTSCIAVSNNENSFQCNNSTLFNVTLNQTAKSGIFSSCIQQSTQVSQAQADLKQAIDQTAKTEVKNAIAACLLAAAVLAIAVAIAYAVVRSGGGGGGGGAGSKIKFILIFLVVMLLIFTYLYNECNGNMQKIPIVGGIFPHWCKTQRASIITYIVFSVIMILFVYLVFVRPAMAKKT